MRNQLMWLAAVTAGVMPSVPAVAQQERVDFRVCDTTGVCPLDSYVGPGGDMLYDYNGDGHTLDFEAHAGAVSNAYATSSSNAYYGAGVLMGLETLPAAGANPSDGYNTPFNGLSAQRRTESYEAAPELPANSIRWFDSFTNSTTQAIIANIGFYSYLGSRPNTHQHAEGDGYLVTGQYAPGRPSPDPVIAHLYGNNAYAFDQVAIVKISDDNILFVFPVTVAPGETVSIMNVNLLFAAAGRNTDPGGALYAQDVAAAIQAAKLYVNDPIFAGLTAAQIETIINWDNIVLDASLPAAGMHSRLSWTGLGLFRDLLAREQRLRLAGASGRAVPGGAGSTLGYAAPVAAAPALAAVASAIADAGGQMALYSNEQGRLYLLGGASRGELREAAGTFGFDAHALGIGVEQKVAADWLVGLAVGKTGTRGDMAGVYDSFEADQIIAMPYVQWEAPTGTLVDLRLAIAREGWQYARVAGAGAARGERTA